MFSEGSAYLSQGLILVHEGGGFVMANGQWQMTNLRQFWRQEKLELLKELYQTMNEYYCRV